MKKPKKGKPGASKRPAPKATRRKAPANPHLAAVLGRELEDLRHTLGLTQHGFAAVLGITRSAYVTYEQGRSAPPLAVVRALLAIMSARRESLCSTTSSTRESSGGSPCV